MEEKSRCLRCRIRRCTGVIIGIAAGSAFAAGVISQSVDLTPERLLENLASKNFSGKPITIRMTADRLKPAFDEIGRISGLRFELDPSAVDRVLRKAPEGDIVIGNDMPWDAFLDCILRVFQLGIAVEGDRVVVRSIAGGYEVVEPPGSEAKSSAWIWLVAAVGLTAAAAGWFFVGRKKGGLDRGRVKFALDALAAEEIKTKILYLFDVEKAYREEDLSLQTVAARLSLPPHHVSWVVNELLGRTFSRLVNSYRIEEIKRRLGESADAGRTILEIAFDAGFNTKTAFNKAFKQQTGMTPSEFREKNRP